MYIVKNEVITQALTSCFLQGSLSYFNFNNRRSIMNRQQFDRDVAFLFSGSTQRKRLLVSISVSSVVIATFHFVAQMLNKMITRLFKHILFFLCMFSVYGMIFCFFLCVLHCLRMKFPSHPMPAGPASQCSRQGLSVLLKDISSSTDAQWSCSDPLP